MINAIRGLAVRGLVSLVGKDAASLEALSEFGLVGGLKKTPPKRGTAETLNAYMTTPWLRATTNKIAKAVGSTTWRLYVVRSNGKAIKDIRLTKGNRSQRHAQLKTYRKNADVQEITDHPALDVLFGGNEFLIGSTNFQLAQIYYDLIGESFMMKERDVLGTVVALWPVPPHWVRSTPTPAQPYFEIQHGAEASRVPMDDMLWMIDPSPLEPYGRGAGGGKAISDEIQTDEFASKHIKAFFYNSARPDIIISGDGLDESNTKRMEQGWLDRHQGFWRSYKPFFVSKNIQIKELSQTFQAMQMTDLRKFSRDSIHQFWGVPPEILGITESSNRATIDAADYIFGRHVVQPRLEVLRSVLQARLINEYDERIVLEYDSPVAEDKEHKLKVMTAVPYMFTQNQWQRAAGEPEMENGDVYLAPFNLSPATEYIPSEPAPAPITTPEGKRKDAAKALTAEESALIEAVVTSVKYVSINDRIEPVIIETIDIFGESQAELIGTNWIPTDPQIKQAVDLRMGEKITGITDNTRDSLRLTLTNGIAANETAKELESRLRVVFRAGRRNRAATIARTETVNAQNYGHVQAMRQGGVEKKQWLSSRDERVRESHAVGSGLDLQIVPINDNFVSPVTGATGPYPGEMSSAAESVNCRCTTIAVFNGRSITDEAGFTKYWKAGEADRIPQEENALSLIRDGFTEQENDAIKALKKGFTS